MAPCSPTDSGSPAGTMAAADGADSPPPSLVVEISFCPRRQFVVTFLSHRTIVRSVLSWTTFTKIYS